MPKKSRREAIERAEDAKDLRWLRETRKKPCRFRPLEEVIADIEGGKRTTRTHRREVYR